MVKEAMRSKDVKNEVDKSLKEMGLKKTVEKFLKSEEVADRIKSAITEIRENMREIEARTFEPGAKKAARDLMNRFEMEKGSIRKEICTEFKLTLLESLEKAILFMGNDAKQQELIEKAKDQIPQLGMVDIEEICARIVGKRTQAFMRTINKRKIPAGMTESEFDVMQFLFGGAKTPITEVFPGLF